MNVYLQSGIVTLTIIFIIWDLGCSGLEINPGQKTPISNQYAASSASFIENESNSKSGNKNTGRDYVNPQFQQHSGDKNPSISQQNSPQLSTTQTPVQNGRNRGAVRDYVNPSNSPGSSSAGNNNFRPSPRNFNLSSSVRDYVNPNFETPSNLNPTNSNFRINLSPSTQIVSNNNRSNIRDYVAPQRPNRPAFPPLPNRGAVTSIVTPISLTTPISYANKASGGVTTKAPVVKPLSLGLSTTPTTPKPDNGPTDQELREFTETLLRKDVNNAARFVTVNLQGKTTSQSKNDEAPNKLLTINPEAFQISTISKLKLLHNNYILETNENEYVTPQEKLEENDLLDAILTTPIMQHTRNFLITNGKISKDPKDFKDLLKQLWFNMYSRGGGRIGSSGFEHIFLVELKSNEVSGLHNWIYFDQAETDKLVDYLGYLKTIDLGDKGTILKFHFKLKDVDKPVDSMFIGTSPELEMALYTTCYLFRVDRVCPVRLNGHNFTIRTFNFRYRGKNMIGSAFPEI